MSGSDKANELLLMDVRPDAPLVRTNREFDGHPSGTLGYIVGVASPWVRVRLAGSDGEALMLPRELQDI